MHRAELHRAEWQRAEWQGAEWQGAEWHRAEWRGRRLQLGAGVSRPTLRRSILVGSVQRLLDDDEQVHDVAMLFTRHRWFLPYAALAGVALFTVAAATGVDDAVNRLVLAACGVAVAAMATTEHWVLAETSRALVLLRSSRIRQYARSVVSRFPPDEPLTMVGSTVITSDWRIEKTMYTLTKRWEPAMRRIAGQA